MRARVLPPPPRLPSLVAAALVAALLGAPRAARAAPPPDAPIVEVLTMTPGDDAFERFGHTAIRVDAGGGAEPRVYNYGTYDADDPRLVRRFLRHELPYRLSVTTWAAARDHYATRRITLQELALDPAEARRLVALLDDNARPERREYRYEFFRDNCSTRVRDAIDAVTHALAAARAEPGRATFRRHVRDVLAPVPLYARAIDLALNARADDPTTRSDDAFLPRELEALLGETRRADGRPLVAREATWIGPDFHEPPSSPSPVGPACAALLVALAAAALDGGRRRWSRALSGGALALYGLVGGLVGAALLVTSLTPYDVARWNGNLLALSPLLLPLAPLGALLLADRLRPRALLLARRLLLALAALALLGELAHVAQLTRKDNLDVLAFASTASVLGWAALRHAKAALGRR